MNNVTGSFWYRAKNTYVIDSISASFIETFGVQSCETGKLIFFFINFFLNHFLHHFFIYFLYLLNIFLIIFLNSTNC